MLNCWLHQFPRRINELTNHVWVVRTLYVCRRTLQWQVEAFFLQLGGLSPIARIVVGFLLGDDYSQHQQPAVTWLASRCGVKKKIKPWLSLCSFIVILLYGHHTAKVANFGQMQLHLYNREAKLLFSGMVAH